MISLGWPATISHSWASIFSES